MLHQDSGAWVGAGEYPRNMANAVTVLVYRSRAAKSPTEIELDELLRCAQRRNLREGLTGLLVYDHGYFFQWLEGPETALNRVWHSIRSDSRHRDLEILRQQVLPQRFFGTWDMRLGGKARHGIDKALTGAKGPADILKKLAARPKVLADGVWDRVFCDSVVPQLELKHPVPRSERRFSIRAGRPGDLPRTAEIWHASPNAGSELADALLSDGNESTLYVQRLMHLGADMEPLFCEVFEPAARHLGAWWDEGRCNDFDVTLAMGRLQLEVRRVSSAMARHGSAVKPGHAILVAPQPGEPHGLNASMCSELFWRDGWDVCCAFPSSDSALRGLVRDQWFDVIDLSLSGALLRDQQLQAMRTTIRAVQAASLNPALAILVEGRSFFDRPRAHADVGADLACVNCTEAVLSARRLLDARPAYPRHSPTAARSH